eukprot:760057-Hanusia_phi.AAC.2
MVGRPVLRYEEKIKGKQVKDIMVGDDAEEMRNMLEISYPVDKGARIGCVDNCGERRILLTEPPQNPKQNREKLFQRLRAISRFEKYGFEGVHVSLQAILTLYAQVWSLTRAMASHTSFRSKP